MRPQETLKTLKAEKKALEDKLKVRLGRMG